MVGLGFADDTFIFLKASNLNIAKCMIALNLYSTVAGLNLNFDKSLMLDLSIVDFDALI